MKELQAEIDLLASMFPTELKWINPNTEPTQSHYAEKNFPWRFHISLQGNRFIHKDNYSILFTLPPKYPEVFPYCELHGKNINKEAVQSLIDNYKRKEYGIMN